MESAPWSSQGLYRLLAETLLAFLRDQSREVKKSSSVSSEQTGLVFTGDAGRPSKVLLILHSLGHRGFPSRT